MNGSDKPAPAAPVIIDSCGCVFCDLGSIPRDYNGKPAHFQRDHTIVFCTKGAVPTPHGPN